MKEQKDKNASLKITKMSTSQLGSRNNGEKLKSAGTTMSSALTKSKAQKQESDSNSLAYKGQKSLTKDQSSSDSDPDDSGFEGVDRVHELAIGGKQNSYLHAEFAKNPKIQQARASVALTLGKQSSSASSAGQKARDLQAIANTIRRASVNFTLKDGSDAGGLVIENERLQTTTQILNNKIKIQDDSDLQIGTLQKKLEQALEQNKQVEKENAELKTELQKVKSLNLSLEQRATQLAEVNDQSKITLEISEQKVSTLTLEVKNL